jgi:hypothetical protein
MRSPRRDHHRRYGGHGEETRVLGPAIPSHWQLEAAWPGRQPQVPALLFTFCLFSIFFNVDAITSILCSRF